MASWPHSHWVAARPRTTVPRRSAACRALRASPAEEASGACKPRARAGCVAKATSCPTWPRSGASNLGATSPARALAATPQTAPSPPRSDLRRAAAAAGRSAAGQPSVPLPGAPQCPTARTLRSSAGPPCGWLAVDGPQPRSRLCPTGRPSTKPTAFHPSYPSHTGEPRRRPSRPNLPRRVPACCVPPPYRTVSQAS